MNFVIQYQGQVWLVLNQTSAPEAIDTWLNAENRADYMADDLSCVADRAESEVWRIDADREGF